MSLEYAFRPDINCLLFRSISERKLEDYRQMMAALKADDRIQPGYVRINDQRRSEVVPSTEFALSVANLFRDLDTVKPPRRGAVLVEGPAHFGMARVYQAHRGDASEIIRVVRSLREALEWLDLPQDLPDPFLPENWTADWRTDSG